MTRPCFRSAVWFVAAQVLWPASAGREYANALALEAQGKRDEAVRVLQWITERWPAFERAYFTLASIAAASADASSELDETLGRKPLAEACAGRVQLAVLRKDLTGAERLVRECAVRFPESFSVYGRWVRVAQARMRELETARELENSSALTPSSARDFGAGYLYVAASTRSGPEVLKNAERLLTAAHRAAGDVDHLNDVLYFLHREMGRRDDAKQAAERLLNRALQEDDPEWLYRAGGRLAELARDSGAWEDAVQRFQITIAAARELGRSSAEQLYRENLGACLFRLGRFSAAIAEFESARDLAQRRSDKKAEAASTGWLAELHYQTGDYSKSLAFSRIALRLSQELRDPHMMADQSVNLAFSLSTLGQQDGALTFAGQAYEVLRNSKSAATRLRLLIDVGHLYAQNGNAARALAIWSECARLAGAAGDRLAELELALLQAETFAATGRLQDAARLTGEAVSIASAVNVPAYNVRLQLLQGSFALREGRTREAEKAFRSALNTAEALPSPSLIARCLTEFSKLYETNGDLKSAAEWQERALEYVERMRQSLLSPEQRAGFLAGRARMYKNLARLYVEIGDTRNAFRSVERGRARALFEEVRGEAQRKENHASRDSMHSARAELLQARLREAPSAVLRQAEIDVLASTDRYVMSGPNSVAEPSAIEELQRMLPHDAVLLHYNLNTPYSILFVIAQRQFTMVRLRARRDVEAAARRFTELVAARPNRLQDVELRRAGRQLFDLAIAPAGQMLRSKRTLFIVPDGVLEPVPWPALIAPGPAAGWSQTAFLAQRHVVILMPSASLLASEGGHRKPQAPRPSLLACGSPRYDEALGPEAVRLPSLPYSEREVRAIARLFPRNTARVRLGADAAEGALKRELSTTQATYLHFAAHGLVYEQWPAMSGLAVGRGEPDAGEDGILRAYEIAGLRLPGVTAVLPVCRSAGGKLLDGEGVTGLARAFLRAGAANVISSLWTVQDESAATLMQELYRYLLKERAPGEALRQMYLQSIQEPEWSHPHYWSTFVLYSARW